MLPFGFLRHTSLSVILGKPVSNTDLKRLAQPVGNSVIHIHSRHAKQSRTGEPAHETFKGSTYCHSGTEPDKLGLSHPRSLIRKQQITEEQVPSMPPRGPHQPHTLSSSASSSLVAFQSSLSPVHTPSSIFLTLPLSISYESYIFQVKAEIHSGLRQGCPQYERPDFGFLLPTYLTTNIQSEVTSDPHLLDYPDRLEFAITCGDSGDFCGCLE